MKRLVLTLGLIAAAITGIGAANAAPRGIAPVAASVDVVPAQYRPAPPPPGWHRPPPPPPRGWHRGHRGRVVCRTEYRRVWNEWRGRWERRPVRVCRRRAW
jgi:hypothetical protein